MKKYRYLSLSILLMMVVSCGGTETPGEHHAYFEKNVDFYVAPDVVDHQVTLRYYVEQPNIPYISVSKYYKEFFNTNLALISSDHAYTYYRYLDCYVGFNAKYNYFYSKNLYAFNGHPDFISETGAIFLKVKKSVTTDVKEKIVDLNDYSIEIYEEGLEAYVPLSFLSCLFGGLAIYDIAYNGKDLYRLDRYGGLGTETSSNSYGDKYFSELSDLTTERTAALANYTYNELCFVFDNLRGYTSQLLFGDENLLTLGLDGLLERYHPKVKQYLLSLNKERYLEGLANLFYGLSDGGHTGILSQFDAMTNAIAKKSENEFIELANEATSRAKKKTYVQSSVIASRIATIGSGTNKKVYKYESQYKTAYICFDSFEVDYVAWDNYYNNNGDIPVNTDSYAFVRDSLYKAKQDGAEYVVLDVASNGGGDTTALNGIVGLLNEAQSFFTTYNVFNSYTNSYEYEVDINLDGQYNKLDVEEAKKFNFKFGILTSAYSFSCANLFPYLLKELGFRILGEQSGGGSCAISVDSTADGVEYVHSSYLCMSGISEANVDGGVEVDFPIEHPSISGSNLYNYRQFYNFQLVSEYLATAYN